MTENELTTELEENGWEGRIGGHSKPNYIHKISNQEGYGVFVNTKETFLAIFFIYWTNMNSKEYETKIIKYKDLPEKDYVQLITGTADMIFRKGVNDLELEKIKDDF